MSDATNYTRMLAPPDFNRRVDIHERMVKERLLDGWKIDPHPDKRPEIAVKMIGGHKGRPALVCASGPSMAIHRPDAIYRFACDRNAVVYATNNAFNVCRGLPLPSADYLVILDERFYDDHKSKILEYLYARPPCLLCTAFTVSELIQYHYAKPGMARTPDTDPPYEPGHYFHGNSSGCVAAQMAMQAGCNPIYLLGHDLTVAAGMTHGNGVRNKGELHGNYPQGRGMVAGYELLAKHAKAIGVTIVNLSPVSALECFPRATLDNPQPQDPQT